MNIKILTEVNARMVTIQKTTNVPLLPLRGLLVYPSMVLHIDVGRNRSVAALEQAMLEDQMILLVTQKKCMMNSQKSRIYIQLGQWPM